MDGGGYVGSQIGFYEFAAMLGYAKFLAEQSLGRGGAEADDHFRLQAGDFGLQPGAAGVDFRGGWLFVDAAFPSRLPAEMFHRIRDVNFFAIDSRFEQRFIEQIAGRADEGLAGTVFLIAGDFSYQHHLRIRFAFAEDGLRGALP